MVFVAYLTTPPRPCPLQFSSYEDPRQVLEDLEYVYTSATSLLPSRDANALPANGEYTEQSEDSESASADQETADRT